MSFISGKQGTMYAPGYFLADDENCVRETREIPQTGATTDEEGGKHHKMGEIFPANDGTAEGILYEDVDVTYGAMPGSVVTKGIVYLDSLALAASQINPAAKSALADKGFKFIDKHPDVTR